MLLAIIIIAALLLGYLAKHAELLGQHTAKIIMTAVMIGGYPIVGLLSIWAVDFKGSDLWLPTIGGMLAIITVCAGLIVAGFFFRTKPVQGLFGMASGLGNTGITLGSFVAFILFGEQGLGLGQIFCLMWDITVVLFCYPVARHYSGFRAGSLGGLMLHSIFDWRSIGLVMAIGGVCLSVWGPDRPAFISQHDIVRYMVYTVTAAAYFGIGLRLHISFAWALRKMALLLAGMRFVLSPAVAAGLILLTAITPWPVSFQSLPGKVLLIQSSTAMAVTVVALANMFGLKPHRASVLFIINTIMYLAIMLPLTLWFFSR